MTNEQNIIIRPQPVKIRLSPLGFHRYAEEFLAVAIVPSATWPFSPVPYYLVCHSIELALKAFLLTESVPYRRLKSRDLGHNLINLLDEAKCRGIAKHVKIMPEQEQELGKAHEYYKTESKGFEYFQVGAAMRGYHGLPDLRVLHEFASQLVANLRFVCS